jgi:hypothetical protein
MLDCQYLVKNFSEENWCAFVTGEEATLPATEGIQFKWQSI